MPLTTFEADLRHALGGWVDWPAPEQPEIPVGQEPWAWDSTRFWAQPIEHWRADPTRTMRLEQFDIPISVGAGSLWQGVRSGFPFQILDPADPKVNVLVSSRPLWPIWDYFRRGFERIPLPRVVRIQGDPAGGNDRHWKGLIPGKTLFEAWVMRHNFLDVWACSAITVWDLTRRWQDQAGGVCAAKIPQFPLLARWDQIQRGRIDNALFVGLDNYAAGMTGPARGFDGDEPGHPCRAGERLRMTEAAFARFAALPENHPARIVAVALREFGCVVGDRSWGPGSTNARKGAIASTQDHRWQDGDPDLGIPGLGDMGLRLVDFEVIS